jgi:hypothetical protein
MAQQDSSRSTGHSNGKERAIPDTESFEFPDYELSNTALTNMFEKSLEKLSDSLIKELRAMNQRVTAIEQNQRAHNTPLNTSSDPAGSATLHQTANISISPFDDIGGTGVDLGSNNVPGEPIVRQKQLATRRHRLLLP